MRLFVNGVEVPVSNRIEILVEVAEGGETLTHGVKMEFRGGRFDATNEQGPAVEIHGDRQVSFLSFEPDPAVHVYWGKTLGPNSFRDSGHGLLNNDLAPSKDPTGTEYGLSFTCEPRPKTWRQLPPQL